MNMQERMVDTRTFRIAAIAVAAAVVLGLAAYLFGTGLRADTPASVAPSPLGSSLTVAREAPAVAPSALGASSLDARGARTIVSAARAASLAALAKSRSDFYADLSNSARAASRTASLTAALAKSRADFYAEWNNSATADKKASFLAALAKHRAEFYGGINAADAAVTAPSSAGLSAAEYAVKYGIPAASVIMAESVDARLSVAPDPATDQSPWIKPEGIRPATASGADQLQWIKPEGIRASGAD